MYQWDVFISHNHKQKPWVRDVVNQWRGLGLKVFFDEDTIDPGEDTIAGIERGLENSRHVILIITPESVMSQWVALETACSMYTDPSSRDRRFIPLLLEPTPESDIKLSVRRLARVDLTNPCSCLQHYHRLLRFLGISTENLPKIPGFWDSLSKHDSPIVGIENSLPPTLETGTMLFDSEFYIRRDVDKIVMNELRGAGRTVVIKGHRQAGKSSLLCRLHQSAMEQGRKSCLLDFQSIDRKYFNNLEQLFIEMGRIITDELDLASDPEDFWSEKRGAKSNLTRFLEKAVIDRPTVAVQILFDEADICFSSPVCVDLFSTIRLWHNRRATAHRGNWTQLDLVIAHATDPALWIPDLNQSPFNVGTRVTLVEFNREQIAELNLKYGNLLKNDDEINVLMELVDGHPFLCRLGLHTLAVKNITVLDLKTIALDESGPFVGYLRTYFNAILKDTDLKSALLTVMDNNRCNDETLYQRLWTAGLIRGESRENVRIRSALYQDYIRKHL